MNLAQVWLARFIERGFLAPGLHPGVAEPGSCTPSRGTYKDQNKQILATGTNDEE
jgi:hypothetical protein